LSASAKFIGVVLVSLLFVSVVFAAPPSSKYNAGETLSPNCSPGDTNCTVKTPAVSGSNSDITELTGLTTDLNVAQGGTGASTVSGARTNLGLVIGANVQAYNAYLTDIAGITANQGDIIYFNGTSWVDLAHGASGQFLKTQGSGANPTWATVGGGGDLLSTNNLSDLSNIATARTNLGLAIGSDIQAYDAQLSDIAGLTPANGYFIVGDGTNFNAVAMSGDGTIGSNGALSISADAVALGTDTTGNYVQSLAGGVGLSGGNSGSEGSALTLNLDINGLTAESAVNNTDTIAVYDASATAIRKMTRANFLSGVTGALVYQGSWDATANIPSLSDATGSKGNYYVVSVAGSQNLGSGSISFTIGDWAIYNGSVWEKLDSVNDVQSVFGRTGVIAAGNGDYTATQIANTPAGNIASTNVQGAINELDAEKQPSDAQLADIAGLTPANGYFIVGDGTNFVTESGNTAKTSLGVGVGDSPQFTGLTLTGNETINAQGDMRLADADSSNYVGFQASTTVPSNVIWTLPTSDGTNGQVLSTDGSGILSWASAGSGDLVSTNNLSDLSDTAIAKTNLGLGNVENTALSTWAGTSNINTLGTIGAGIWQGTVIGDSYISSASTWNSKQAGNAYLTDIAGITANQGDIIYFNGANWVDLAPGASGQYLKTQGSGANPAWASVTGSNTVYSANGTIGSGRTVAVTDTVNFDSNTFVIDGTNNKIGIGTTTPTQKLEVAGSDVKILASGSVGSAIQLKNTTNGSWSELQQTGDRTRLNSSIGGGDLLTILNTGNVGIGMVAPVGPLQIEVPAFTDKNTDSQQVIISNSGDNNYGIRMGFTRSGGYGVVNVLNPGVVWGNLVLQNEGGRVGIGTTTPVEKLQVNGGISVLGGSTFNGDLGYSFYGGSGDTDGGMFSPADGTLTFATNNIERMRIDSSGNVGIGTTPSIGLAIGDSDTGLQQNGDGILDIYSNSVAMVRVDGNGISSGGFAGRLKRVSDGAYVVPADGVEYYSPDQQGGKYGTVYRMYIVPSWINGYNFVYITANGTLINSAIQVLNIANSEEEVITDVSYSDVYRARIVKSTANNYLILHVGTGYTLLGGWVDYSK